MEDEGVASDPAAAIGSQNAKHKANTETLYMNDRRIGWLEGFEKFPNLKRAARARLLFATTRRRYVKEGVPPRTRRPGGGSGKPRARFSSAFRRARLGGPPRYLWLMRNKLRALEGLEANFRIRCLYLGPWTERRRWRLLAPA